MSEPDHEPDPGPDPAKRRFFMLQATRLSGVAGVVLGMLMISGKSGAPAWLEAWLPSWLGYVLIASGLVDVFVIPPILVRKWRTPPQ